jgi:DNA-binding IclR family transcriptional regulator
LELIGTKVNTVERGEVQTVDRAVTVLEVLAARGEAGVSDVAAWLEVHKSTAFRLLGALENRGLVEQVADRGKYRLGFGLGRLAGAVTDRLDVSRHGRPVCDRPAAELGETVNLAVPQSHHVANVDEARGRAAVATHNWVGQLTPLHCTSSGKVLLSQLPDQERSRLLAEAGLPALTPRAVSRPAALEEELRVVRARGYAVAVEEYGLGLTAVAAPVRVAKGRYWPR